MLSFLADENVTLVVPFLVDDEYVVPDTGSVTYTLRDNLGAGITGQTNKPVAPTAGRTEWPISILAIYNGKALETENRTLTVSFTYNLAPYHWQVSYRLTDWFPHIVGPNDVRAILGVTRYELPDEDLDIAAAYLTINTDLGGSVLYNALVVGGMKSLAANNAITYKAAIDCLPSLPGRVLREESNGTTKTSRFSRWNFKEIEEKLSEKLSLAMATITGVDESFPSLMVAGSRTDPVTNA
jgi:hypothetical protein